MAKMIPHSPHINKSQTHRSQVYAVVTIPTVRTVPTFQRRSLRKTISWFMDVAVSLGLGAVMLCFLVLLLISL